MASTTYQVDGMTCDKCEAAMRASLARFADLDVNVDADTGLLTITGQTLPDRASINTAVEEAGFQLVDGQ